MSIASGSGRSADPRALPNSGGARVLTVRIRTLSWPIAPPVGLGRTKRGSFRALWSALQGTRMQSGPWILGTHGPPARKERLTAFSGAFSYWRLSISSKWLTANRKRLIASY
jgi:hypothetical protein